jgi:hypothetical protein
VAYAIEMPTNAHDNKMSKPTARLVSRTEDGKVALEAKQPRRSSVLAWLEENGPIADFPVDPGHDDLLPLDDVKF